VRRVVVTGVGIIAPTGVTSPPFLEAIRQGRPLGNLETVERPRGGSRLVRVARVQAFQPERILDPRALRRLSVESRVVTAAFLLASRHAACGGRPTAPERTGTFLGTGFGSLATTAEYLRGLYQDGMAGASPTLFSESLASAPVGHAAIDLDARGPSMALAGGDASMIGALDEAVRSIGAGRVDRAIAGGLDLMPPILVGLLARLAIPSDVEMHVGEGAAALVLESEDFARATEADVLAEVRGVALSGDPKARPTDWSHDPEAWSRAMELALATSPGEKLASVYRHGPPSPGAARAEGRALEMILARRGRAEVHDVHRVVGSLAAAGGFNLAAAVLAASRGDGIALVSAGSWGGATGAAVISGSGA